MPPAPSTKRVRPWACRVMLRCEPGGLLTALSDELMMPGR
jgi:hypothetical protein